MSQINNILTKIISAIKELNLSIETLRTTRSEDGSKTHKIFQLLNAKSQRCESLLHILERDVSEHLSGGLMAELSRINKTTKKINLATTNMDCQAMLDGFQSLEGLPERLQIISDQIKSRTQHLVQPSVSEGTQTQSDPEFTDTEPEDYIQEKADNNQKEDLQEES